MRDSPPVQVMVLCADLGDSAQGAQPARPESLRPAWAAALGAVVRAHGGRLLGGTDPPGPAIFTTPGQALQAALALPAALESRAAAETSSPLRIALHSGSVPGGSGPPLRSILDRGRSLLAAATGGDLLLSQAAADAVQPCLPPGVTLLDLGMHRLKDLLARERVFRVAAPGRPPAEGPLHSLEGRPGNLPPQIHPLIGRAQEEAALARLLGRPAPQLVTLTGPAGAGKTRLALQVAAGRLADFADGAWFVALGSVTEPDLVAPAIGRALGLREDGSAPLLERLQAYLADRQLLLVLDNLEHMTGAAALVAGLLAAAPGLRVLATSREALHLAGETTFALPPLSLPDLGELPALASLAEYESVALFVARAAAVAPGFALTAENAAAVAEICVRLDGLPLAIELAAVRSKTLSPAALVARLAGPGGPASLPLLTTGAAYLPARQQTLRGAIGWSYALLAPEEQVLFARLGVFSGGCTTEAATAVAGVAPTGGDAAVVSLGPAVIRSGLASLADKSLLRADGGAEEPERWVMLETIREYAWERLAESGDAPLVRQAHAGYYGALGEHAGVAADGDEPESLFARLEAEHDNLRAALAWYAATPDGAEAGLRLAAGLWQFWFSRGYWSEGRRRLEAALARPGVARTAILAQALAGAGSLTSESAAARAWLEQSIALWRELGDSAGLASALDAMVEELLVQGDYARARPLIAESLALFRRQENTAGIAGGLYRLGSIALGEGAFAAARTHLEAALALFQATPDRAGQARCLYQLGRLALDQEDLARAETLFTESLDLHRALGNLNWIAWGLTALGEVARMRGATDAAADCYTESLDIARKIGNTLAITVLLHNLGQIARERGLWAQAGALFVESLRLAAALDRKRSAWPRPWPAWPGSLWRPGGRPRPCA